MIVNQGGQQVTIVDPKTSNRIELKAGLYELQLAGGGGGLKLSTDRFALKRGDKTVVTVRRQATVPATPQGPYGVADPEVTDDGVIRRGFFMSPHDLLNNAFLLPDGRHVLYSTGGDFQNRQWLPGTDPALWLADFTSMNKIPRKYTGHDPGAISLALSRTGRQALTASEDKTLRLWDLETGDSRLIRREESSLGSVVFAPDAPHAAYVCGMSIHLCDLLTGEELMTFRGHESGIAKIAFCADGRRIVSGSGDKTIRVWDVKTGKEIRRMTHGKGVTDLALFPDDRRVLATSGDGPIVWDLETGQQLRRISLTVASAPDLAAVSRVIEEPLRRISLNVSCVAVSPDGRRALFGEDTAVWLWDLERGEKIDRWYSHMSLVWRVAFSPDGQRAVSTSFDRTVRIWAMPPIEKPLKQAPQPKPPAVTSKGPRPDGVISPRTRAILATLEETVPMGFANETPLDNVLIYIKQATFKGKKPTDPGLPIYVAPLGLQEAGQTLTSTVQMNVIGAPLKITLPQILGQLGLAYLVKDDVLIISSPKGIDRERNETASAAADSSPGTKRVLAKLEQPISMSFAGATPLDDVLTYIKYQIATPESDGIPIHVDPLGLKEAGRSMTSTVSIDLDGVPLKTTLRLMLKQLGLAYTVKDGLLIISSAEGIRKPTGRADERHP